MPPGRTSLLAGAGLFLLSLAGFLLLFMRYGILEPSPLWQDLTVLGAGAAGIGLLIAGVIGTVQGTLAAEQAHRSSSRQDDTGS